MALSTTRLDHLVEVERLRQDPNAYRRAARPKDRLPEVEVLLRPENRRTQLLVGPARQPRKVGEEVPHVVAEGVREWPVEESLPIIHLGCEREVVLDHEPKPAQHVHQYLLACDSPSAQMFLLDRVALLDAGLEPGNDSGYPVPVSVGPWRTSAKTEGPGCRGHRE